MALMPVAEALTQILGRVQRLGAESVIIRQAAGRTLNGPLVSALTNPPFDASSMDGYGLRAADIAKLPASLKLIGESAAGWPFAGTVGHGQAVRIFTGAPVPDGADTVVIQEETRAEGSRVTVLEATPKGANIRLRGQDFHDGDIVLDDGCRLSPRDIMLAAAIAGSR